MNPVRVILVDDHAIVRDGIKVLISVDGIEIIGEASTAKELFGLLESVLPDIVILDISLPDMSGIEIAGVLSKDYPEIKIVILSMHVNEDYVFNAIKAGAMAYLPKNTTKMELLKAIEQVASGEEYFSESVSGLILKSYVRKVKNRPYESAGEKELSKREHEILKLFAEGKSNREIADALYISSRTVESHKNHIMQKLELKSTVELIKFAIRNNIIEL